MVSKRLDLVFKCKQKANYVLANYSKFLFLFFKTTLRWLIKHHWVCDSLWYWLNRQLRLFLKNVKAFVSKSSRLTDVSCPSFARLFLIEYGTFAQHYCSLLTALTRKLFAFLTILVLNSTFLKFLFTFPDYMAWVFEPYIFQITCS